MSQSILQIILRVTKEGQGERQAAKEAKELNGTLSELGLGSLGAATALGVLSGAVMAVAKFTKDSVDSTLKYAMEVKALKDITGETAEETSRVIQVMDDFQVSTGELTAAQKKLAEQGLSLNIETLAKLSDEYKKLNSGAERTKFLVDNFGKSGLKMAGAMQAGGDAIREMSAATLESQIFTEQAIRDADEYRLAMDALNDEWNGFTWTVGRNAIPFLTGALKVLQDRINDRSLWRWENLVPPWAGYLTLMDIFSKMEESGNEANVSLSQLPDTLAAADARAKGASVSLEETAESLKALSDANKQFYKNFQSFQSMEDSFAEKAKEIAAERIQIEKDKADYIQQYGTANVEAVKKFDDALAENGRKAQANASEHEKATRKVILGYMEQKMMADGLLDEREMEWLIKKGQAWGIYSQDAVNAYRTAMAEADKYIGYLDRIPKQVSTEIIQKYVQKGYDMQMLAYGYASGTDGWETVPAGYPNDSYPVFLTSGEKFAVIPAGQQAESYAGMPAGSWSGQGGPQEVVIRLAGDAQKLFQPVIERGVKRMR